MSSLDNAERPVFSSLADEPLLAKPVNKLAIVSLLIGLIGSMSLVSHRLAVIALVAAVVGAIALVQIAASRNQQTGGWMAAIGLFLGSVFPAWGYISDTLVRNHATALATEYALHYVDTLAQGDVYRAAELRLPAPNRQLPGMDLKAYYEAYEGEVTEHVIHGGAGAPDPKALVKKRSDDLRKSEPTKFIQEHSQARWQLSSIAEYYKPQATVEVVNVLLSNSETPGQLLSVTLSRQVVEEKGEQIADWWVKEAALVENEPHSS